MASHQYNGHATQQAQIPRSDRDEWRLREGRIWEGVWMGEGVVVIECGMKTGLHAPLVPHSHWPFAFHWGSFPHSQPCRRLQKPCPIESRVHRPPESLPHCSRRLLCRPGCRPHFRVCIHRAHPPHMECDSRRRDIETRSLASGFGPGARLRGIAVGGGR